MDIEIPAIRNPDLEPSHPGEILREHVLPQAEPNISKAAKRLGLTRAYLHRILACEAPVSPKIALAVEKAFKVDAGLLVRLQGDHDTWRAGQLVAALRKKLRKHAA